MDWRAATLVATALVLMAPDGCGSATYEVEATLRNDWTENIHLYVFESAGGGGEEDRASRNRVSPGESRTVDLSYDAAGSYDIVLRAGRDGMADTDSTCILDLPEPESEGLRYDVVIEASWQPGWTSCSVEITQR